jgi:hypothetical protein
MDNISLYPLWKQALQEFIASGPQSGNIIDEAWKIKHFGIKIPTCVDDVARYQLDMLAAFSAFSSALLTEYQIYLRPAGKGSHVVVPPAEQTDDAWNKRVKEISRSMNSLRVELFHVNVGELTDEQRRGNSDKQSKAAMMTAMFRKTKRLRLPKIDTITD